MANNLIDPVANIPSKESTSEQWVLWYKSLKAKVGKDDAVNLFIDRWKQAGSDSANNEELRKYMKSQGVKIGADWKDVVWDTISSPFEFVGDIFGKIESFGIWAIVIIALFVVLVLFAVIKFLFKASDNQELIIKTAGSVANPI
jgi:hypothetical protein